MAKCKILKQVRWEKPCSGWMKLNTDGSLMGNLGLAGGEGLLRDANGNWVGGFARRIGIANRFKHNFSKNTLHKMHFSE